MRKVLTLGSVVLAAVGLTTATAAMAQSWPTKPIHVIVPYPPGGNVDTAARIVAAELNQALGQPVIVENKAGAGGMIAGDFVSKADADGYTLFMAANGPLLYSPTIFGRPLYHWKEDFVPISRVTMTPLLVQAHPSVNARTVPELIALAKSQPNGITLASPGAGTTNHLLSEMLQKQTGASWTTVHYKGNAPAVQDVLGGRVQFSIDQVSVAQPFVKEGRTKALAVIAPRRVVWLPDVPTLEEQGIKGIEGQTFTGLLAPAATPGTVVDKLSSALRTILGKPEVVQRFQDGGTEASWLSPQDFSSYLAREEATWIPIIKAANIKAQ
ncbi:MAG: tripartite tricarboxylate transporter substrate binding protein [Burkholderiaceae bacterium]